jgi:hypothetical protein
MADHSTTEADRAGKADPVVVKFAGNRAQLPRDKSEAQILLERQAALLTGLHRAAATLRAAMASVHGRRPGSGEPLAPIAPVAETSFFPALEALTAELEASAKSIEDDAADLAALF